MPEPIRGKQVEPSRLMTEFRGNSGLTVWTLLDNVDRIELPGATMSGLNLLFVVGPRLEKAAIPSGLLAIWSLDMGGFGKSRGLVPDVSINVELWPRMVASECPEPVIPDCSERLLGCKTHQNAPQEKLVARSFSHLISGRRLSVAPTVMQFFAAA